MRQIYDGQPDYKDKINHIIIKGASEHNLKNVDIKLPKNKLIVFTGVSGSGKSSLAFNTIYAEGQRRYVESLSSYARQFLGQMDKPKYETISGLSPTIAIEQKAASKNPRSTVGTITEVYDYLRVLFARIGTPFCHICGKEVGRGDAASMTRQVCGLRQMTKILILAPIVQNRKGEYRELFFELKKEGFSRVRVDGIVSELAEVEALSKNKKHNVEVVVDRLMVRKDSQFQKRVTDSIETALKLGKGQIIINILGGKDILMSEERSCCGFAFPELMPQLFSFNSPSGMCSECNGIGSVLSMDEDKIVPDKDISIREGAIVTWKNYFKGEKSKDNSWGLNYILSLEKQWNIDFDIPWKKLPKKDRSLILYGSNKKELKIKWKRKHSNGLYTTSFEGVVNELFRRYKNTKVESMKSWYANFMSTKACTSCDGERLKAEVLAVKIEDKSIMDICSMTIKDACQFLDSLKLTESQSIIASELLKEIIGRLKFLINVGLEYLTLDRKGPTLSGGEAQRIRLASQIGSELTGVLYILDEPSIGLHQRDNQRLINTLRHLKNIGNTLIVVEHDQEAIESADWLVDLGPGAGNLGGEVVASGTPLQVKRNLKSLTGRYLAQKESIPLPNIRRTPKSVGNRWLKIIKAEANNLAGVDVEIPLGIFTCITGVSGAGKSSIVNQILWPALARKFSNSRTLTIGKHKKILGLSHLDKVINIDQRPIGRTPRSNPATYTKVHDLIRDFFSMLPEAKSRGYKKGRFSFNVKGGRCEHCRGDGHIKIEMHFLADVYVPCSECQGKRFNKSTLEVLYKGMSIADILGLTVNEAKEHFKNHYKIIKILDTLIDVGLGYIRLGQPATTLSGGEAQRIKLARELAKNHTGRTLYILDEPTTGLHFDDIKKLLTVLQRLVDKGNSVIVIEHNLDVIKNADWIIDMGPDGGARGGKIIAHGTPEEVAGVKESHTGNFLKKTLR